MKYGMVILSGVADVASAALGNLTPLEKARKPALDELAMSGRLGTVATAPRGTFSGSDAALLTLLGYDPLRYPLKRGPLEAAGAGLELDADDLALSGSFVSIYDERIVDLTAGRITTREAQVLLDEIAAELRAENVSFHILNRYRFLVVVSGGRTLKLETAPPHAAFGRAVREVYPRGADAGLLGRILDRSRAVLKDHEINRVRIDLGENPADGLWLWGEGADLDLPSFESIYGLSGAAVAGAALARGVARKAGFEVVDVPGATGDFDTDLEAKAEASRSRIADHDLIFVHLQAANEASHLRDPKRKVRTIQEADVKLVRPLTDGLRQHEAWRLLVASDHVTATESDRLSPGRAPFLIAGHDVAAVREYPFDEAHSARADLHIEDGTTLIGFFLGAKPRPRA